MVYFLVIKRVHSFFHSCTDTCYKHYANWMNLKNIKCKKPSTKGHIIIQFNPQEMFRRERCIETEHRLLPAAEQKEWGDCLMAMKFFSGVRETLWNKTEVVIA